MSGDHWRSQAASSNNDAHGLPSARPFGSFGANGSSQQSHVLPPPPSNYPSHLTQHQRGPPPSSSGSGSAPGSAAGPSAHSLSIADLTQSPASRSQYNTAPPPTQNHAPLSRLRDWPSSDPNVMREMEIAELRAREEQQLAESDRQRQLDRMAGRQPAPIQSHVNIPLHQPVASKVQGSLQGPNGLLGNGAAGATNPQSFAAAAPPPAANAPQPYLTQPSPGVASQQNANGQQPILNDALSYLDQVKVRFSDQPDVYNRFLDIMKDFKSQAIDTPGVINRVSELFTGHPMLIQGFNTFLPPGYRIECGTDENPDAIRVTTPSGTMTQSMQPRPRGAFDTNPPAAGQHLMARREDAVDGNRVWGQAGRLPPLDAAEAERFEHENAMQQDQRNVSHLQNAATAAANGQSRHLQGSSPPPFAGPSRGMAPGATAASAAEAKRGVVEFNHAIDYVNKIKNRFAQQPEIYKQFLEILQTYQRESKPIQDVYAQVTQLFLAAPDLLEDFKQFLPESAAHAKAQAAARAQQEAEAQSAQHGYLAPLPQSQTPRPAAKLPPMGQFDPPSTSKDNKKRKAPGGALVHPQAANAADSRMRTADTQAANKRQKFDNKPKATEIVAAPIVDPTLVPALPEPLPPAPSASTTQEEIGFFERAKKQIANRSSYTEFLKLINLFTQDIIDKYTLAERVQSFIGSNPELMNYFKGMLGIGEHEEVVEARLRPDSGRVNLAHCRSFGPSYRHLPKRDQNKPCKGRDGMCYEVLNDVWASHPTWASEDSGFVAHRKNQYEEALHRIEEERHDYDFHIESCQRTIQLMQPLVSQIAVMNDQEKAIFRVDRGLGGASEAIPKRIILKIYGRDAGNRVLEDMYARPAQVMPVVLSRLKQKLEEWKQVQREWEKVWRDQINKQFYKSLDHQGIAQKNADKKNFQLKSLVNDIQARYEEQKRAHDKGQSNRQKYQLEYEFADYDVLIDTTRLVVAAIEHDKDNADSGLQSKIKAWLLDFVVRFFDLDRDDFIQRVEKPIRHISSLAEERDSDNDSDAPVSDSRKNKAKAATTTLLQQALKPRNGKEASVAPTSKESTPAPDAMSVTSAEQDASATEEEDTSTKKWIKTAQVEAANKSIAKDEPYSHETYNFYANSNLYGFFRLFEMLYSRLLCIKKNETAVAESVRRFRGDNGHQKAAIALRMIDKLPTDFFKHVDGEQSYYVQILEMCGDILVNRGDKEQLEETLRRFYNHSGWQLYSVDRLVTQILRFLIIILTADAKEKSLDIANLFFKDREREETTHEIEVQYRNQVKKMSKDGEVFRITWHPLRKSCTIRYFPEDDSTFDRDELSDEAKWQYYVATYTMTEPTEGVTQSKLRRTFIPRNIATPPSDSQKAYMASIGGLDYRDDQTVLIDIDSYKLQFQGDYAFNRPGVKPRPASPSHIQKEAFEEKFVRNVAWMKDQRPESVEARKAAWEKGVKQGLGNFEAQFSDK